jgi:cytoskeletal protein CcmA (bactofilin family)
MASLIQVRRGTAAEWTSANPVLAQGEIGFVTDENKFKVGNGSSAWSSLPYLQADAYIDSVVLGTDTTGDYVAQVTSSGDGISITGSGESASVVISNTGVVSLTGTANEIDVSASTGAVTLSLPAIINADTTGNAATASALATARTISLGGDLSGSASFDGTSNITINATVDSQSSVNSITGTANEIEVSASVGDITISLPDTINANTTGTAASLTTARTIALSGDVSGSVTFDGSASVDIVTTIEPNSVTLGSDTTGDYVSSVSASGFGISVSGTGEGAAVSIQNTGVISLAGTANEIDISASTGAVTLSLPATINADTTGNSATSTKLASSKIISLSGDVSGSVTFDGSASVDISTSIQPNSVTLGTDTTGDYISSVSASGSGISVSGTGEDASVIVMNTGVTSLAGTASQIAVSASNGGVTVSFPSEVTFPGTVTLNANPEQALQAATKQYVDAVSEGLHVHASVIAATTASVNLNDVPAAIDGVTLTDGARILIKNQSNAAENGIYTYSASADAFVRASDFNSTTEIAGGDFLFVTGGNTYDNTGWVQTEKVTTLGTDPILFTQFSGAGTYLAGTGLELVGSTFNNIGVLSLAGTGNEIDVSASSGNITLSLPATINADTTGNAATATQLANSRAIALSGDLSGSASFDGSASISINATIEPNSVTLGSDTTGDYVSSISASGSGISVTGTGEGASVTIQNTGVTSIAGTANEIDVSASTGSITLSLPATINADLNGNAASATYAQYLNGQNGTYYAAASVLNDYLTEASASATYLTQTNAASTYLTQSSASTTYAPIASPTFTGTATFPTVSLTTADTATAASHYIVEVASDGIIRPKTLANVRTEIVTTAAVNSASATTLGTITSGTWNGSVISATYIDTAIARLASPTFTGTVTVPTPTNSTDAATKGYVDSVTLNTQTVAYGLVLSDAGKVVEMNVGTANNLTVPLNSSQPFPIGTTIDIVQYGAGQTTIVPTGGVTIRSSGGKLKLTGQYSAATLYKRSTDEWVAMGDLSA